MHARGRPTPSSSNPGDRAGGKERTRGKKCCGHQCCPCAEEQDRDALWGRWDPDYGVGGTHRLRGFGAASGRADIAGAPPRGEGLLLLSVAATPIPTHARWVQWSQGRAIAGCSFGPPPAAAQAPSCPCLHGWGGAEALLVLPHSGLVWREGTAAGGLPCTPRDARMGAATGQQRGVQQRVSGAFTHLHRSSLEPAPLPSWQRQSTPSVRAGRGCHQHVPGTPPAGWQAVATAPCPVPWAARGAEHSGDGGGACGGPPAPGAARQPCPFSSSPTQPRRASQPRHEAGQPR